MKNTERIIKYLEGELNEVELKQFEVALLMNSELALQMELHKDCLSHHKKSPHHPLFPI